MIKRLLTRLYKTYICDVDPHDAEAIAAQEEQRKADAINKDIQYLWKEIDNATYHHHFSILEVELKCFAETYKNVFGCAEVVQGLAQHLSERKDAFQLLNTP